MLVDLVFEWVFVSRIVAVTVTSVGMRCVVVDAAFAARTVLVISIGANSCVVENRRNGAAVVINGRRNRIQRVFVDNVGRIRYLPPNIPHRYVRGNLFEPQADWIRESADKGVQLAPRYVYVQVVRIPISVRKEEPQGYRPGDDGTMTTKESIEYRRIRNESADRGLVAIPEAASDQFVARVGCLAPDRQLSEIGEVDDGRNDV